jgi:hypothetical protein
LLDGYYDYKGWNRDGIPTRATLHALGLDYVAEDFLRRGILKPDEEFPADAGTAASDHPSAAGGEEEASVATTTGGDGHTS